MAPEENPVNLRFYARHPFRIDLPEGEHVRFASLNCAAKSAVHWGMPITDESTGEITSYVDAKRICAYLDTIPRSRFAYPIVAR